MIRLAQAQYLVRQAVDTQGEDFVYNPKDSGGVCRYYPQTKDEDTGHELPAGNPRRITGCLIGTALVLAGETRHLDPRHRTHRVIELHREYPELMSVVAMEYLQAAQ